MKESYPSLSDALRELRKQGYTTDFNYVLKQNSDYELKRKWEAGNFDAVKYYRYEGMSNPDDDAILYVIEGKDGTKGVLVDNYSGTENQVPIKMLKLLNITHEE